MLIQVFGIWLMAQNITYLEPRSGDKCFVSFTGSNTNYKFFEAPCDVVAKEINQKMKDK